ncbi:MAG TPA: hypothetical protein VIV27_08115, partial [Halioglobus sp.]
CTESLRRVMRDRIALQRYLQRHVESGLPRHRFGTAHWRNVLVIPTYREAPAVLDRLTQLAAAEGRTLVILLLNRPVSDGDPQANASLREALRCLPRAHRDTVPVHCLNVHTDVYLHDMETLQGPTPDVLGVGLARKTGCDLALQWMVAGGISGQWLCNTDADATLPPDYFGQLDSAGPDAVAAVFPFRHVPGEDAACDSATALYELRLHQYVLGLEYAGSPYAYHSLGSCVAVRASAYAHVRGFPKRAGAEDFYLLNKLAKLGPVARLQGDCIRLQSRHSTRVPFGTGPAVAAILAGGQPHEAAIFYHPRCFEALAAVLASVAELAESPDQELAVLLGRQGLDPVVAAQAQRALHSLNIPVALAHCRRQCRSSAQFQRQFHQWFDAFRTLKFIHAIRDAGWPQQSLAQLEADLGVADSRQRGERQGCTRIESGASP